MTVSYDLILKNLQIIDGTGAPSFYGDIALKDDLIVNIGQFSGRAELEYDCTGLTAAPGFIDIHNHSDFGILIDPEAKNYVSQGVTTILIGQCGMSGGPADAKNINNLVLFDGINWLDSGKCQLDAGDGRKYEADLSSFKGFLELLEGVEKSVNLATLVGHGNVRSMVLGMEDVKPDQKALTRMRDYVKEAMENGAFGLSTGLIYDPGVFARTEELISLAKVAAAYGGLYATHMRNESDYLIDSVLEAIKIARKADIRVEISHLKASGKRNYGLTGTVLDLIKYYRRFGLEVTCDVYPYHYSNTGLENCLPPWTRANGRKGFLQILQNSKKRAEIKDELIRQTEWENILLDATLEETFIADSSQLKEYEGKSIAEIAKALKKDPYETIFNLLLKDPDVSVIVGGMSEADVRGILKDDLAMVASDGRIVKHNQGFPHPRSYGTFSRVLSKYVREEELLTLEKAVWKMSGLPAWKLGLTDRGLIRPGLKADLAIFDIWKLKSSADFTNPHQYSSGMEYVFNNGKLIYKKGEFTGNLPGKVLRKND